MTGSDAKNSAKPPRSILFLDPIGHLLATHDRQICQGLSDAGYHVSLITNNDHPLRNLHEPYEILPLFGRCVGDRHPLVKGLSYALFFPRFAATVWRTRPDFAVIYFSLYPAADSRLIRWLSRRGIRTVLCAHDVLPLDEPQSAADLYRTLYNAAWRILTFSDCAKKELVSRLNVPSQKVCTLYFGEEGKVN